MINITNFDVLKQEISKTNNREELEDVLNEFRYDIFTCNMTEKCIINYSCKQCYRDFLNKEI